MLVNTTTAGALPPVYRACSFISDSLASVDLQIVQEQPDGGKKPVADSDVARALADWSFEQKELFLFHAALGGNGFAALRRNARGGVQAIESVIPRFVMAALDEAQSLFYCIGPQFGPGTGEPEVIAQPDMLHLRFRHIGDANGFTVFGAPPIVTAAEQVGLILAARLYQSVLWKKGAVPIGVLTTPTTLKGPVIDRLREQWNQWYTSELTGKTAILEAGLTYQSIKPGITAADTDLVANNHFGVEEIGRLYSLPASVLGQTHQASYSTAVEEYRASVLHCLRPWAARFTDCLGRALLTRDQRMKGLRVEASLDHMLVSPGKEMSEYLKELVNAGILSTDECRNALGYPDLPQGGDVHRVPVNMTALSNLPKIGLNNPTPPTTTP